MTTKQPPAQKHLDKAREITAIPQDTWSSFCSSSERERFLIYVEMVERRIATALSQVEVESAQASKVVFTEDDFFDFKMHKEFKERTKGDDWHKHVAALDHNPLAKWQRAYAAQRANEKLRSQLTLTPNEPDDMLQKAEKDNISSEHVTESDVFEHEKPAPKEPEVKAQGFEDAYTDFKSKHVNESFMPKDMARAMYIAGQAIAQERASKPTLVLPEKKPKIRGHYEPYEQAWNDCLDEIARLNAPALTSFASETSVCEGKCEPDAVPTPQFKWKIEHVDQPDKQTGIIRATVVEGEKDPKRKIGIFEIKDAELICAAIARLRLKEFYKLPESGPAGGE